MKLTSELESHLQQRARFLDRVYDSQRVLAEKELASGAAVSDVAWRIHEAARAGVRSSRIYRGLARAALRNHA